MDWINEGGRSFGRGTGREGGEIRTGDVSGGGNAKGKDLDVFVDEAFGNRESAGKGGFGKGTAEFEVWGEGEPIRQFVQIGARPQGDPQSFKRYKTFHVTKSAKEGQIIEVDVQLRADNRNFMIMEKQTREASIVYYASQKLVHGHGPKHVIWVDWVEWEGPLPREESRLIKDLRTSVNWKTKPNEIRRTIHVTLLFSGSGAMD